MLDRQNFEIAALAPKAAAVLAPQLCGLLVAPGATYATDRTMAVRVTADWRAGCEQFKPFILDRESALNVARAIPSTTQNGGAQYAVVDPSTDAGPDAILSITGAFRRETLQAPKLEGSFPDIDRVMARCKDQLTISVDPDRLAAIVQAIQRFCRTRKARRLKITVSGPDEPLRFDVDGDGQTFTAVLATLK